MRTQDEVIAATTEAVFSAGGDLVFDGNRLHIKLYDHSHCSYTVRFPFDMNKMMSKSPREFDYSMGLLTTSLLALQTFGPEPQ